VIQVSQNLKKSGRRGCCRGREKILRSRMVENVRKESRAKRQEWASRPRGSARVPRRSNGPPATRRQRCSFVAPCRPCDHSLISLVEVLRKLVLRSARVSFHVTHVIVSTRCISETRLKSRPERSDGTAVKILHGNK